MTYKCPNLMRVLGADYEHYLAALESEAKDFDREEFWCRSARELDAAVYFQSLARMTRLGQVSLPDVLGHSSDSLARVHLAGCSHLRSVSPWLPPSKG